MNSLFKYLVKIGGILLVAGLIIAAIGFAASGFDLSKLDNREYESHTVNFTDESAINKIVLDTDTSDVRVTFSDVAEKISVSYTICKNKKSGEAITSVEENITATCFTLIEKSLWKNNINIFGFTNGQIDITIPKSRTIEFDLNLRTCDATIKGMSIENPIKITTSTGDITIESSKASSINVETTTGDIKISNTECNTVNATAKTGDITIKNTVCTGEIEANTSTGRLTLRDVEATSLSRVANTGATKLIGSVKISTINCKVTTGDVNGKDCVLEANDIKINTSTGDITLSLAGKYSDYGVSINISTGNSNTKNQHRGDDMGMIEITSSTGDARLYFSK